MRFENTLLKSVEAAAEAAPEPSGGDFIDRVNLTIKNFKSLAEVVKQFKGAGEPQRQEPKTSPKELTQKAAPGVADYMRMAIQAGYGDTPVGKLIEDISPHTIKQIVEILKNAGLRK